MLSTTIGNVKISPLPADFLIMLLTTHWPSRHAGLCEIWYRLAGKSWQVYRLMAEWCPVPSQRRMTLT